MSYNQSIHKHPLSASVVSGGELTNLNIGDSVKNSFNFVNGILKSPKEYI